MTPGLTNVPDSRLLSQAIAACTAGVIMTDARQDDHPIIYVNPAFERLSGYAAGEILGRNCRFLQGQDRDQTGIGEIRRAIAQGRSTAVTLRNYRKDGTLFHNELSLSPVRDAEGTLTHYLGFQNDVTAREEARQHLAATLERITDGVVSFDQHLNCTYLNPAAASIVGRRPEEMTGLNVSTAFPDIADSAVVQAIRQARDTGTPQTAVSHLEPFGKWIELTAYPAEDGVSVFTRDLTEQRRAREQQRVSEAYFATLFEVAPIALAVARASDLQYIDVNPEFLRQSGYSRGEVVGHTPHQLNVWVNPPTFEDVGRTVREQGQVLNREVQVRQKSGAVADTVLSIVPVMLGGQRCLLTLVRDVTQEKRAQRTLQDSEARHRQLATELQRTLDLSLDMITTTGPGARVISVSAACERLLGYTPDELIGRSLRDFVHPDDRVATHAQGDSMFQASQGGRQVTVVYQNRYVHKDGHVVWLEWNAAITPGDPHIHSVTRDITRRKAAEEDQAFLAAIVQASQDAILGVTLDGTVRSWNVGAEELYGYAAAEAVGQPVTLIVPPERHAEEAEMLGRAGRGERTEPFESVRIAKDGRRIPVLVTVSPILDAGGRVVGVSKIAQDITARLAAEKKIHDLNEELRQQLSRITGLREIDQAVASGQDFPRILGMILDNVAQQLVADAATLLLLDPHTLGLEYASTWGFTAPLQGLAVRLGRDPAGEVALSRRALSVPNVQDIGVSPAWREVLTREGLRAYYGAPLLAKGRVLGVIEVFRRELFEPSALWLETLQTLTAQAAIAVDNAQLFTELERKNLELRLAYDETIEGWARALDLRDKETEGHSRRVTEMTVALCQQLGTTSEQLVQVRRGALLHDIGKVGIPDAVLLKPGKLTDEEWAEMRKHPGYAVDLLSPIEFLRPALDIPQYHHEKWDGSGYPLGLSGHAIPLTARAFAVVDVYDALTSDRPYRRAWTHARALEHIRSSAGTHFDPAVVAAFVHLLEQEEL